MGFSFSARWARKIKGIKSQQGQLGLKKKKKKKKILPGGQERPEGINSQEGRPVGLQLLCQVGKKDIGH